MEKGARFKEFLNEHSGGSELNLDLLTHPSSSRQGCSRFQGFPAKSGSVSGGCQILEWVLVARKEGTSLLYFF